MSREQLWVVAGGVVALTLLLVPVLYVLVEGWGERRRSRRGKHAPAVVAAE